MDLEVRHLRAICALADAGSVSRAATRLGISQPALSTLLQRIERSFGGTLFLRGRTGVRPTPLGEQALRRARLTLADLDGFLYEQPDGDRATSTLRLGSATMACLGTLLARVTAALPGTTITLKVDSSAVTLAQALAHDRLDAAVVLMMDDHDVPFAPELAQRALVPRVPIFVALAEGHRLADRPEIELADLAEEAWISPPGSEDGSLASLRAACRRAGFDPRVRYDAPDGGGIQLIAAGHAVRLVEPGAPSHAGVVVRRLAGDPQRGRLVFGWRRSRIAEQDAERVYLAVARAYTEHAVASPTYGPWWAAHPEVHPRVE
ncbi:LysR family transcriptional regulator [Longispora urticae]